MCWKVLESMNLIMFAHSARPGRKVAVLGRIRKGLNYQDVGCDLKNSMVCKRVVAFTDAMGEISLMQSKSSFREAGLQHCMMFLMEAS